MSAPIRAPDLAELETLVACAAEGSLSAAAARLGISRPAVAKRVANIEAIAGSPVLDRGGRGVRLTDAGATVLAGARRVLDERDVLVGILTEMRGHSGSAISGIRDLLGHSTAVARAAQRPEARLAETERVLEIVLRACATGVVISDPDTAVVHEVNEAFCRFAGRSREQLVGRVATDIRAWDDNADRDRLVAEIRRAGSAQRILVRARRPDGTLRVGEATSRLVELAGTPQLLSTVDDVTDEHRLDAERTTSATAYRAVIEAATLLLTGRDVAESFGGALAELRRGGGFRSALLWDAERGRPLAVDGEPPPRGVDDELRRGRPLSAGGGVVRLGGRRGAPDAATGLAGTLPPTGHSLVLLSSGPLEASAEALFAGVLTDLAALSAAAG